MKVGAIVLNYNSCDDTLTCVDYLKKQEGVDLEIIVVDNNSSDESVNKLEQLGDSITLIKSDKNDGYSAGNNLGLKDAVNKGCDYAMIVNPDVEIRANDIVKKAAEQMKKDERIAALGCDIIHSSGHHQNPMKELKFWQETFWPVMTLVEKIKKKNPYIGDTTKSGYCEKLSGCCIFLNLDFIKSNNYLDENLFLYSEEAVLATQVKQKGYKMYYLNDVEVYHMHKPSSKEDRKNIKQFCDSRIYYIENYAYKGIKKKMAVASVKLKSKIIK